MSYLKTACKLFIGLLLAQRISCDSSEPHSHVQVGAGYTYLDLKPHCSSSFHGNLGGLVIKYSYYSLAHLYAGAHAVWKEGNTHTSSEKRTLLYIDSQEQLGYTFALNKASSSLTLFTGFGYRHLGQKLIMRGQHPLRFHYNEFYVPLGLLVQVQYNPRLSCNLNITWMPQVFPTVSIHPLHGAHWTLSKKVSNLSIELPLLFTPCRSRQFQIVLKPFFELWNDGHSTAKNSSGVPLDLPGNTYRFYGADISLAYSF